MVCRQPFSPLVLRPLNTRAEDARPVGAVDHRPVSQEDWVKSCVYDLAPVALRTEFGDPNVGGSIGRQITLTGQAEWELAAAASDLSLTPDHPSKREWTRVKLPNTVQHALFQAGKTSNPWYADNYKSLQSIQSQDWYLRRKFRVPEGWRGRHIRLRFDGLDYVGVVWLDGKLLGIHEGMSGGPTFDITDYVKSGQEHELLVRLVHETVIPPKKSLRHDNAGHQVLCRRRAMLSIGEIVSDRSAFGSPCD